MSAGGFTVEEVHEPLTILFLSSFMCEVISADGKEKSKLKQDPSKCESDGCLTTVMAGDMQYIGNLPIIPNLPDICLPASRTFKGDVHLDGEVVGKFNLTMEALPSWLNCAGVAPAPASAPAPSVESVQEALEDAHHEHVEAVVDDKLADSKEMLAKADHAMHRAEVHIAKAEGNATAMERAEDKADGVAKKVKKLSKAADETQAAKKATEDSYENTKKIVSGLS
eukprot:CAMPEP_0169120542 /NCGR_PEP_ID=MMETSP1015-20121227/32162_1 /TAXON_ID=342587 /ORGANISM="Karlodinium micrum, Strain CCMP2283" /LENGTH=224 /DNA_ID=CAMNT_0009183529 /DNA_START=225 /DNA_END=899 /DNA_ORIENTATION=+